MNPKTREQLLRRFLADILNSDLTAAELRRVAEDLPVDSGLWFELGTLLRNVLRQLSDVRPTRADDWDLKVLKPTLEKHGNPISDVGAADVAYDVIQRRRLSKREVVSLMNSDDFTVEEEKYARASMREILTFFFSHAPVSIVNTFMARLGIDAGADPYLRGITRTR